MSFFLFQGEIICEIEKHMVPYVVRLQVNGYSVAVGLIYVLQPSTAMSGIIRIKSMLAGKSLRELIGSKPQFFGELCGMNQSLSGVNGKALE